jgi:hypothetical protein
MGKSAGGLLNVDMHALAITEPMRTCVRPLLCAGLFLSLSLQPVLAADSGWSLDFLIVDEKGEPLPGAIISVAYSRNDDPNVKVTPNNWTQFMVHTNRLTDSNGVCRFSGAGTTDAWQCHFQKADFVAKRKMYNGPANFTSMVGPGSPHQSHTVMLVRTNADIMTWPKFEVTFKVVDENGNPIKDARARLYYYTESDFGNSVSTNATGLTDSRGVFFASVQPSSSGVAMIVNKDGYYESRQGMELYDREEYDPVKWHPKPTFVLKDIRKPIPMYAGRVNGGPPTNGQPVGLDLMIGDWVAPSGRGRTADIIFLREYARRSPSDYDYKLTISFPDAGDGLQPFAAAAGPSSGLLSPHEAPESGYNSPFVRADVKHQPKRGENDYDPNRNYFIRVRTTLDESGKVKSALYGKIYGDFMQFVYYLNPTPNDRTIEFDTKRNLLPHQNVNSP